MAVKLDFFRVAITIVLILCAIGMVTVSIYQFINTNFSDKVVGWILSFYYILFAIKIIVCELCYKVKFLKEYFPYMFHNIGKAGFVIFCGGLMLENDLDLQCILGIVLIIVGVLLMLLGCGIIFNDKKQGEPNVQYQASQNNANP